MAPVDGRHSFGLGKGVLGVNKKWYRRPVVKLALVLAAVVSSVGFAISMVMVFCVSSVVSSGDVFEPVREHYEDTNVFARRLGWDAQQILEYLDKKDQFETEGQYDPDKVVDILTYADGGGVSGVNESGLSYRLGEIFPPARASRTGRPA